MKLIFLDFDGVLAPFRESGSYEYVCQDIVGDKGCLKFEDDCVKALNTLTDKTKSNIVISSSWRYYIPDLPIMKSMCEAQGVTGKVVGMTDSWGNMYNGRKEEVLGYIDQLEVDSFIIIDDTNFSWGEISGHWIHTDPNTGLTHKDTLRGIEILGYNSVGNQ